MLDRELYYSIQLSSFKGKKRDDFLVNPESAKFETRELCGSFIYLFLML